MTSHFNSSRCVHEKRLKIWAADLLLAFDKKDHVHRQRGVEAGGGRSFQSGLHAADVGEDLALVVRRAAREHHAVVDARLKRRGVPKFQRVGGLDVVVPVDEHRRPVGLLRDGSAEHDRVTRRVVNLRFETDGAQLFRHPAGAGPGVSRPGRIGGNTRKTEKLQKVGDGGIVGHRCRAECIEKTKTAMPLAAT